MNSSSRQFLILAVFLLLLGAGCSSPAAITNHQQPGPAIGHGVGAVVGTVGGNAAGAVVGVGEGIAAGAAPVFDTRTQTVRRWRSETTADGRVVLVPEDIQVDSYGRPISPPKPVTK